MDHRGRKTEYHEIFGRTAGSNDCRRKQHSAEEVPRGVAGNQEFVMSWI